VPLLAVRSFDIACFRSRTYKEMATGCLKERASVQMLCRNPTPAGDGGDLGGRRKRKESALQSRPLWSQLNMLRILHLQAGRRARGTTIPIVHRNYCMRELESKSKWLCEESTSELWATDSMYLKSTLREVSNTKSVGTEYVYTAQLPVGV